MCNSIGEGRCWCIKRHCCKAEVGCRHCGEDPRVGGSAGFQGCAGSSRRRSGDAANSGCNAAWNKCVAFARGKDRRRRRGGGRKAKERKAQKAGQLKNRAAQSRVGGRQSQPAAMLNGEIAPANPDPDAPSPWRLPPKISPFPPGLFARERVPRFQGSSSAHSYSFRCSAAACLRCRAAC